MPLRGRAGAKACSCSTTRRRGSARPTRAAPRHASASPRRPASFPQSRSAASATAARSSPTTTNLAELLRSIRVHGQGSDKYDNVRLGLTARLDTMQAAILIEKLKIFEDEIEARDRVSRSVTRMRCRTSSACRESLRRACLGVGAIYDPPACGRRP
jgi:hypothetical protein